MGTCSTIIKMKNIIIAFLLTLSVSTYAQNTGYLRTFSTVTQLQGQKGAYEQEFVYLYGSSNTTDYRGGIYMWNAGSTATQDLTYMSVIAVTNINTGRWVKVNQNTVPYAQGTLFRVGMLKIFAATGVTDSNGEFSINLTAENTSNGTALFTSIIANIPGARVNASTANDVVTGSVKVLAGDLKTCSYRFVKGGTIGILGVASLYAAPASTPVSVLIVGI